MNPWVRYLMSMLVGATTYAVIRFPGSSGWVIALNFLTIAFNTVSLVILIRIRDLPERT